MLQDPVLREYRDFLANAYNKLPHPGMLPDQSPVMQLPVYVSLTLHRDGKRRKEADQEMREGSQPGDEPKVIPIELQELLKKTKPDDPKTSHIVLVKGVPGSGKTTLSWHASQKWAAGQLFQDCSLFILIPLRNRRIQEARSLADLIPHPDKKHRKDIAQAISDQGGEEVCFWFEGWDEVPEVLHKSFVCSFIRQDSAECSLPRCSIVVTSRPNDAFTAHHPSHATVKINEFEKDQIQEYIAQNLQQNPDNAKSLAGKIEEDPHLQTFCSLPINLAIMVHLFYSFSMSLPKTMTELFHCLILNLMQRNLKTRWDLPARALRTFKSFEKLPQGAMSCFKKLCKMAYEGTLITKVSFNEEEFEETNLPLNQSTLGLVKIHQRIGWLGLEQDLTFLHYTLQEFLAALHISMIENEGEQAKCLQRFIKMRSQQTTIIFYAGITNLKSSKAKKVIMKVAEEPLIYTSSHLLWGDDGNIHRLIYHSTYDYKYDDNRWTYDDKCDDNPRLHLFLILVNCIYETQSHQLCQKVFKIQLSQPHVNMPHQFQLDYYFRRKVMTPRGMRALGYFTANCCKQYTCRVQFEDCILFGRSLENFVNEILAVHTNQPSMIEPRLGLSILDNNFMGTTPEGVLILLKLIRQIAMVSQLSFRIGYDFSHSSEPLYVKYLLEALAHNTSCEMFHLDFGRYIFFGHERYKQKRIDYYIVLLLSFCHGLKQLGLHRFIHVLAGPCPLFASALAHNTNLLCLDLSGNPWLSAAHLSTIATALKSNYTLRVLKMEGCFSRDLLATFIEMITDSSIEVLITKHKATEESETAILRLKFTRAHYLRHRPLCFDVHTIPIEHRIW